jgi:Fe-S-cluster-containing dehydrogenase component
MYMGMNRRDLLKLIVAGGGSAALTPSARVWSSPRIQVDPDRWGMLVDTTRCIGCRHCEWACKQQNGLPSDPLSQFSDTSVFETHRRPDAISYTVVNRFAQPDNADRPVYIKVQCMHCEYAACVSACLVGAFEKEKGGSVQYDGWKCMGCRYCMVACPFQVPSYEYFNAFTPVVRKCTFCFERVSQEGKFPACAHICPQEVMTFGRRADLLNAARERMAKHPDRYVSHIYGEHEVGGTAWLYLASVPFDQLGLPVLGHTPVTQLNETVQHAIFKYFIPPIALYGFLGAMMWMYRDKDE